MIQEKKPALPDALETISFNIWEGVYGSFQEAKAEAVGPGFSGEIYLTRALLVAKDCLHSLRVNKPIPQFHKQRSSLLPVTVVLAMQESLSLLDFGGGLGIGYMTLLESVPEAANKIHYTIIEVPEVCEVGKQLHPKNETGGGGGITYLSKMPTDKFDIVHASSSLQYIEDWKEWVFTIAKVSPTYILLSDVFAGSINPFVSLQNYYGSRIPHWFLGLEELLQAFDQYGYKLLMKSSVASRRLNHYDVLPMDNFPESLRLTESLHLLFKIK
jgi:putative methyltransferase (TIGR04325 family)